jgi:hypothetical protein
MQPRLRPEVEFDLARRESPLRGRFQHLQLRLVVRAS